MRIYARKWVDVAVIHPLTGAHTSTYTGVPEGTEFFWASDVVRGGLQLWSTNAHGYHVVALSRKDSKYFTTDPREIGQP